MHPSTECQHPSMMSEASFLVQFVRAQAGKEGIYTKQCPDVGCQESEQRLEGILGSEERKRSSRL